MSTSLALTGLSLCPPLTTARLRSLLQPDLGLLELARLLRAVAHEATGSTMAFVSTIDPANGALISHTHVDAFAAMPNLAEADRRMVFPPDERGHYPALIGHALNVREAFYTNDASRHPASTGVPSGHAAIGAFLAAPALDAGRPIGMIGLANPTRPYTDEDLATVQVLADLLSVAIRRTWYQDSLKVSHLALESLSIGVVTASPEAKVVSINEAFTRLTGYSHAEVVGKLLWQLPGHGADAAETERLRRGMTAQGSSRVEILCQRKDGTSFRNAISVTRVQVREEIASVVAVMEDVTPRREAERSRLELEALFQQSQKMESLGHLAGGVAHDVNNVLSAIGTVASRELLNLGPEDTRRKALATIERAVERGAALTSGLLGFARKSTRSRQSVHWNDVILEHVELLRYTTLAKVSFEVDLAPTLGTVEGEVESLGQAFLNLCLNAIDAMRTTGRDPVLQVSSRQTGSDIVIEVTDNGSGMSPEVRARALEPFFTTKPPNAGTGLGLALVQRVVELHEGRLDITTARDQGTTVRLVFPSARLKSEGTTKTSAQPPALAVGGRILVVDDDDLVRESLVELLETLRFEVVEAADGEMALETLQKEDRFTAVMLDMNMPGLGGATTLVRLRALRPSLPVIVSTGLVDQTVLDLVAQTPHTCLLRKPLVLRQLLDLLNFEL